MKLKIGSCYKIIINVNRLLTYEATILSEDDNFITFKDKFNNEYNYNKNVIVSVVEVNGGFKE